MWTVLAWVPHRKDPYRLGSGVCSARFAQYNHALAVADAWASTLARVPGIVIEVFRSIEGEITSDLGK